jgi:3-oxoacyl-[acyl-carrier-protein] synthase III
MTLSRLALETGSRLGLGAETPVARGAMIDSVAMAVPEQVVTNQSIAARLGVDERWIESRTGVVQRRIARADETLVDLAADATTRALELAGCAPGDVDLLLVATMTAEDITPNAAPLIAKRADLCAAGAMDIGAACAGWLSGVRLAAGQVEAGRAQRVVVVGADLLSRVTDRDDRSTAALFADGAGAVLVSVCEGASRIGPVVLGTDPAGASWVYARRDEGVIRMRGHDTFKAAVSHLTSATHQALDAVGLGLEDIDLFVFHQGNGRIVRAVGERLGVSDERMAVCVDRFGNTSAASIPMALADAAEQGRLEAGARVLMGTFGAGFTWGAAVVEWGGRYA